MKMPETISAVTKIRWSVVRMYDRIGEAEPPFFARKLIVKHMEGNRVITEEKWYHADSIDELQVCEDEPTADGLLVTEAQRELVADPFA